MYDSAESAVGDISPATPPQESSGEQSTRESSILTEVSPEVRKVAHINGILYKTIVKSCLSYPLSEEDQTTIMGASALPPRIRTMYQEGWIKVDEELNTNAKITKNFHGERRVTSLNRFQMLRESEQQEVLTLLRESNPHYLDPIHGMAVTVLSPETYNTLVKKGFFNENSRATLFLREAQSPMQIFLQGDASLNPDTLKDNPSALHETHHFVYRTLKNLLKHPEAIPEQLPEFQHAFSWFQDELAAYLLSNQEYHMVHPSGLVYPHMYKDSEQKGMSEQTQNRLLVFAQHEARFAQFCRDLCLAKGIDQHDLLFPIMFSSNFSDIANAFASFVPFEQDSSHDRYRSVYELWQKRKDVRQDFSTEARRFVQLRGLSTDEASIKDFINGTLTKAEANPSSNTTSSEARAQTLAAMYPFLQQVLGYEKDQETILQEYSASREYGDLIPLAAAA